MTKPTDAALLSAGRITLRDPKMPSWERVVIVGDGPTLSIPVNSGDLYEVQRWLDKIAAVRG